MSDHKFTGFDFAAIADAVRQPPLDDLVSLAHARRRRRTGVVATALVVLVVGMAALPLAIGTRGSDPADSPQPTYYTDRKAELFMTGVDSAVGVDRVDRGCTLRFARTNDGGLNWTGSEVGRYRASACPSEITDPPPPLEYFILGERSYLVRDGDKSYLSADYGQTWQDADRAMVTVSAFPARARAVFCQEGCTTLRQLLAADPSTGTVYRLGGQSPPFYQPSSVYPSSDGSIWATYWPGASGSMVVARSIDRGATWNTWHAAKGANVVAVAGVDEREAYLLIESPTIPGSVPLAVEGPPQLLRTTDGGATWTDVGTDLPADPGDMPLTIGSDGSLLVVQSSSMRPDTISSLLVSRDGGLHFTLGREYNGNDGSVGVAPGHAWLYGRMDVSAQGVQHVLITQDGYSWTEFPLPS